MKKYIAWLLVILLVGGAVTVFVFPSGKKGASEIDGNVVSSDALAVTLYRSNGCGCCALYGNYLEGKDLSVSAEQISEEELTNIKDSFNIPDDVRSCHTIKVGDYFVEGHVPVEAIQKLMADKPDILGIALPGMQMGSPGMSGAKAGDLIVYAINKDGSVKEFMRF